MSVHQRQHHQLHPVCKSHTNQTIIKHISDFLRYKRKKINYHAHSVFLIFTEAIDLPSIIMTFTSGFESFGQKLQISLAKCTKNVDKVYEKILYLMHDKGEAVKFLTFNHIHFQLQFPHFRGQWSLCLKKKFKNSKYYTQLKSHDRSSANTFSLFSPTSCKLCENFGSI